MSAWTTLVDAETLAASLDRSDLRIFDCRAVLTDHAAGEAAWRAGHLPGALHADLERDLSGPRAAGAGRHPWPSAEAFAAWLGRVGLKPTDQVVAYDGGEGAYAAHLWWQLRAFGHANVAVLDGGVARWTALGLPIETTVPTFAPTTYVGGFDVTRLLDGDAVASALADGALLIDARGAERFRGEVEPIDPVAGHVPGAVNRPFPSNLADGRFKPAAQLREEFATLLGAHPPSRVVAMCGSGVTACHHLLAMTLAGLDGARLYTGSWSGWIDGGHRPVATGG